MIERERRGFLWLMLLNQVEIDFVRRAKVSLQMMLSLAGLLLPWIFTEAEGVMKDPRVLDFSYVDCGIVFYAL